MTDYRAHLAHSHRNLGNLLSGGGRHTEADKAFRESLAISEKLAAEFPNVPNYRGNMAICHNRLGILLKGEGRLDEAEKAYRESLTIGKKLTEDFPNVPDYRYNFAVPQQPGQSPKTRADTPRPRKRTGKTWP